MSTRRGDDMPDLSGGKPEDLRDLADEGDEPEQAAQPGDYAIADADDDDLRGPDAIDLDFDDPDWEPDFADDADSHEAPPLPSRGRKGAVSVAFLNAGLALEEIVYGRERSKPPAVQEAREGDDDGPIRVHLDPEEPKNSWVSLHPEAEQPEAGLSQPEADPA